MAGASAANADQREEDYIGIGTTLLGKGGEVIGDYIGEAYGGEGYGDALGMVGGILGSILGGIFGPEKEEEQH